MKEFIISRLRESADLKLVFARQATKEVIKAVNIIEKSLKSIGKKGDVAWGLSTSGRSKNIVKALSIAKSIGLKTIGFTGSDGGEIKKLVDCNINVPSMSTPRIQELHITIGHIICELIEDIFSNIKK